MVKFPLANPIRFYNPDSADYRDVFPNTDNYVHRVKQIEGVHPVQYYKDFLINKLVVFQVRMSDVTEANINLLKPDGTIEELSPTDITPTGWTSESVYKYSFTPTAEGIYYLKHLESEYESDYIYVQEREKFRRRLVKIEYYNSENDYGMIFNNNGELIFSCETYFTGRLKNGEPKNELSAFTSDRGNLEILRGTPIRTAVLELAEIHFTYVDSVNLIFSCDNIKINGLRYQSQEVPKVEEIEKTDLVNIVVNLSLIDNDYFVKEIS